MCLALGTALSHAVIPVRSGRRKLLSTIIERPAVTSQTTITLMELLQCDKAG
jgi:hypothetical protein